MVKIAVIGSVGTSVFLTVDRFHQKGETVFAKGRFEEVGGKAFNQAVAAVRMGAQVSFLAAVGDDADGEKCISATKNAGITGHFPVKKGEMTTTAVILTDSLGENRVTVCAGAEPDPVDVLDFEREIAESDILLLQQEIPHEVNLAAIRLAKKHSVPVILNPAPAAPLTYEEPVWLVTPNEQEKAGLGALSYQHCITTLGDKGCSIDDEIFVEAMKVQAVDTTGAGDTFNGTLAVCLAEGMDLEDACRMAVKASGISVTGKGAAGSIPYRDEL